jgi:lipopolysaccharide/colanic/teichoic acid biosynthesis glycosyltransferase
MFSMFKIRSMVVNADRNKVDSTGNTDPRITPIGKVLRACKVDEMSQLVNVLLGDMSLVGPRPNVKRETDLYSPEEARLLSVKPGITDFSSIVFSDLGTIISAAEDANIAYNQLVRPWKSRLGLFYLDTMSLRLDVFLVMATAISIVNRPRALSLLASKLSELEASEELIRICKREEKLVPTPPPGFKHVITSREVA